jgi:hypothetical protein
MKRTSARVQWKTDVFEVLRSSEQGGGPLATLKRKANKLIKHNQRQKKPLLA